VLAVCAAISSLKGGSYSTRVQLATTQEVNAWSYFQSKSVKQHATAAERDLLEVAVLEARTPEGKALAEAKHATAVAEVARYEVEKEKAMADAKGLRSEEDLNKQHNAQFGQAVMLLQIAITLSAVGALIKKQPMWWAGLACGAAGLVFMANGFLLFF
jgi:hypothetical protein